MATPPPPPPPRLPSSPSTPLLGFLEERLKTLTDLSLAQPLAAQLKIQCRDLERDLCNLADHLSIAAASWTSQSNNVGRILQRIDNGTPPDGRLESRIRRILGAELPLLAKEVGRIETVRLYAETTLQLEVLVGDLEDAALSVVSQAPQNSPSLVFSKASRPADTGLKQEKLLASVKAMTNIEKVMKTVAMSRPRWIRLLKSVDFRVEKTLAILRPRALSDHRALLASLCWPPPLSVSKSEKDIYHEVPNSLVLILGDKEKYCQSFLSLCALQFLQAQWEARQHDLLRYQKSQKASSPAYMDKKTCFNYGLWAIDELVHPMASRMEYHFSQWSDQPKFIFALVYKITRDFVDGVDSVLQPLIDKARLVGYSAREAWVSAMVKMLTKYLTRKEFPVLVRSYENNYENMEIIASWLHLVDLMVAFDKRMQVLAASGSPNMGPFTDFNGFFSSLSVLSIFNEQPDWLEIWAEIELKDAMDKLRPDLDDERSWSIDTRQKPNFSYGEDAESFILSAREDFKSPLIADSVISIAWAMIERALALPNKKMRVRFIRSSASLFLQHFFCILLQHCKEVDSAACIVDDNVLQKAIASVNAARYCESVLHEWGEDIVFLEMSIAEDDSIEMPEINRHPHKSFFEDEIMYLVKLTTDFLVEIMSGLLLQFEALCWDYIQNIEYGEVENSFGGDGTYEENLNVSTYLVEALDMLNDEIRTLKLNLNPKDFLDLWRSIADGLDHFLFRSIPLSNVKLSRQGVHQFSVDMRALFLVFRLFCARPEAFFPCITDSLKLLTLNCKDSDYLLRALSKGKQKMEDCLRHHGLFHLSTDQAEKILMKSEYGG